MSQWGTRWASAVGGRHVGPGPGHHVVVRSGAVGGIGGRQIGQVEEGLADGVLGVLGHRVELALLVPRRPALVGQLLGLAVSPALRASPTCLDRTLTLARTSSRVPDRGAGGEVERGEAVDLGRVDPAAGQGGLDRVDVVSDQSDIDHVGTTVA